MDIQHLINKLEISEVVLSYGRGMDRSDRDLLKSRYHPGAIEDRGEDVFIGQASEYVDWVLDLIDSTFIATQHIIMNPIIELRGNEADVEAYFLAYHRSYPAPDGPGGDVAADADNRSNDLGFAPDRVIFMGGRYLYRFEKRDGAWKITYSKTIMDWVQPTAPDDTYVNDNPNCYTSVRSVDDSRIGSAIHPILAMS